MICIKVRFLRLGFILRSDKLGDEDQITSAVTIVKVNLRAVKSGWEIGGKWKKRRVPIGRAETRSSTRG